jgi:hypothetical protein
MSRSIDRQHLAHDYQLFAVATSGTLNVYGRYLLKLVKVLKVDLTSALGMKTHIPERDNQNGQRV